jgi:hypothetical protein
MPPILRSIPLAVLSALGLLVTAPAGAAPTLGFIERWNAPGSTSNWLSQATNTNPNVGGVDGDGYLRIARTTAGKLGSHSEDTPYAGNWLAANVDRIRLCLNDVDADQALEIHVAIGNSGNFWLYKPGFSPPENAWAQFTVDLSDSTQFAHIIAFDGKGFAAALQNVDRVMVRHDLAPFSQTPNTLAGEFGLDNFELANGLLVGVPPGGAIAGGRPVELAAPYPNPARGAVVCAFDTFDDGEVRALIVDTKGRIVRSETLPASAPGRRVWMWNGLDDRGQVAPAGAYRVRVTGRNGGTSRPIIRVN